MAGEGTLTRARRVMQERLALCYDYLFLGLGRTVTFLLIFGLRSQISFCDR
jgi:hypothetical protein